MYLKRSNINTPFCCTLFPLWHIRNNFIQLHKFQLNNVMSINKSKIMLQAAEQMKTWGCLTKSLWTQLMYNNSWACLQTTRSDVSKVWNKCIHQPINMCVCFLSKINLWKSVLPFCLSTEILKSNPQHNLFLLTLSVGKYYQIIWCPSICQ